MYRCSPCPATGDSFFHLPEEVAYKPGDIDGIFFLTARAEVFYKPRFGLFVDQLVEMPDAGFLEAGGQGRQGFGLWFGHKKAGKVEKVF